MTELHGGKKADYIRLLETVANNDDPPFWFDGRDSYRDMLLRELQDANLLKCTFCDGSVMTSITYSGRVELERLKGLHAKLWLDRVLSVASIVVALSTLVSAICAIASCFTNS